MPELRMVMQTFKVDMECDCGEGLMRPTGVTLMSNPAQYPHQCKVCGATKNFRVSYPHIIYEPF